MEAFAGIWEDDCAAGDCEGFTKFVEGLGLTPDEIKEYKKHIGKQEVIVNGENFTYQSDFAGYKATNHFKLGIKNPTDKDIEGYDFQSTPTLINERKMKEVFETHRPKGLVTTELIREIVGNGDKQIISIEHIETGAKMKVCMHKVQRKT